MSKKINASKGYKTRFIILTLLFLLAGLLLFKNKLPGFSVPGTTQFKGAIMDDFPSFPIYPGANIKSSQKTGSYGTEPESYQAYLESAEKADDIIAWYKTELVKDGWVLEPNSTTEQPEAQYLYLTKGSQKATVFVETEENASFVSLHIQ